jgi:hypothetical protein
MLTTEKRINAFASLGNSLTNNLEEFSPDFEAMLYKANQQNPWFTIANQKKALAAIALMLERDSIEKLLLKYSLQVSKPKNIGVIMAGNIPAVGFHDLLMVLLSGHRLMAKTSTLDFMLMHYFSEMLSSIEPSFKDQILFVEKLNDCDAVIATGSDNTARYFEYYFKNIPHIIRRNRNSVAVLNGHESKRQLTSLGEDIFSYFGMGCRNVTKLFVPAGYSFNLFFEAIQTYGAEMMNHNKYLNNLEYYNAVYLMEQIPFLTNNFLHLKEDKHIGSPVSVLHYEYYHKMDDVKSLLLAEKDKIQCIVTSEKITGNEVAFGRTQYPALDDYADGVDTLTFLMGL